MEHAVILIPADVDDFDTVMAKCLAHLDEAGYELDSIVSDWDAAWKLMACGAVQVVIVDEEGHLPVGRSPRVEVAADGVRRGGRTDIPRHRRRPRIIRR